MCCISQCCTARTLLFLCFRSVTHSAFSRSHSWARRLLPNGSSRSASLAPCHAPLPGSAPVQRQDPFTSRSCTPQAIRGQAPHTDLMRKKPMGCVPPSPLPQRPRRCSLDRVHDHSHSLLSTSMQLSGLHDPSDSTHSTLDFEGALSRSLSIHSVDDR